jgi:galactokinase
VIRENERVLDAAASLRSGDFDRLGRLMYESHESLRDDFEVSCPELDRLVELARGTSGMLGARLTGAGFGGCTVNIVHTEALDAFRRDVVERYAAETGLAAEMHVCRASDGLKVKRA